MFLLLLLSSTLRQISAAGFLLIFNLESSTCLSTVSKINLDIINLSMFLVNIGSSGLSIKS